MTCCQGVHRLVRRIDRALHFLPTPSSYLMGLTSSGKTNHRFCHASAAACSRRTTIKMTEERQSFFRVIRYFCFALLREFLLAIARMAGPAKRNQKVLPLHPAPASPGFVLSAVAPRVAVQGPSMALYGSRGIHAARPSARRLRSPS